MQPLPLLRSELNVKLKAIRTDIFFDDSHMMCATGYSVEQRAESRGGNQAKTS